MLGIYADMSCSRRSTVMRRPTVVDGEGAGVGVGDGEGVGRRGTNMK